MYPSVYDVRQLVAMYSEEDERQKNYIKLLEQAQEHAGTVRRPEERHKAATDNSLDEPATRVAHLGLDSREAPSTGVATGPVSTHKLPVSPTHAMPSPEAEQSVGAFNLTSMRDALPDIAPIVAADDTTTEAPEPACEPAYGVLTTFPSPRAHSSHHAFDPTSVLDAASVVEPIVEVNAASGVGGRRRRSKEPTQPSVFDMSAIADALLEGPGRGGKTTKPPATRRRSAPPPHEASSSSEDGRCRRSRTGSPRAAPYSKPTRTPRDKSPSDNSVATATDAEIDAFFASLIRETPLEDLRSVQPAPTCVSPAAAPRRAKPKKSTSVQCLEKVLPKHRRPAPAVCADSKRRKDTVGPRRQEILRAARISPLASPAVRAMRRRVYIAA